jgi:hypothetical protein
MSHEFRCPVCSYVDAVDLPVAEGSREVRCGYCGTPLTLELRDDERLNLEVRVAEPDQDETTAAS